MIETAKEECQLRTEITEQGSFVEYDNNMEAPSFKSVPETAPVVGSKRGPTTMILPWCC